MTRKSPIGILVIMEVIIIIFNLCCTDYSASIKLSNDELTTSISQMEVMAKYPFF